LAYLLELAPIEQSIAKQAIRSGQELPERIANASELKIGLNLYLQAFFELDSERSHAMAATSIPWSSIAAYSKYFDFDEEQSEDLFLFIRKMDAYHLNKISEKMKVKSKK
jgi:DNA-binding transcriptional regulator YhcF (GntR family)